MRAPEVSNAKQTGETAVTWRGAPLRCQILYDLRVYLTEKVFVLCTGVSNCYFLTIENKVWFARYCFTVDLSKTRFM